MKLRVPSIFRRTLVRRVSVTLMLSFGVVYIAYTALILRQASAPDPVPVTADRKPVDFHLAAKGTLGSRAWAVAIAEYRPTPDDETVCALVSLGAAARGPGVRHFASCWHHFDRSVPSSWQLDGGVLTFGPNAAGHWSASYTPNPTPAPHRPS